MAKVPPPQGISRDQQWFTDTWDDGVLFTLGLTAVIHEERSAFQDILVVDTERFGRMLVLDGNLQTTAADEADITNSSPMWACVDARGRPTVGATCSSWAEATAERHAKPSAMTTWSGSISSTSMHG